MTCFTSSLIRQFVSFCDRFWSCCCNCWALTLRTVYLNTDWATGMKHLTFMTERFELLMKSCKNLICYSCIFYAQLHVHLKKWTLKFKLLYLSNCISYFNKIRRICCVNTHIQNLKVWLKPVLKYSIFFYGIVFYWCTLYMH